MARLSRPRLSMSRVFIHGGFDLKILLKMKERTSKIRRYLKNDSEKYLSVRAEAGGPGARVPLPPPPPPTHTHTHTFLQTKIFFLVVLPRFTS